MGEACVTSLARFSSGGKYGRTSEGVTIWTAGESVSASGDTVVLAPALTVAVEWPLVSGELVDGSAFSMASVTASSSEEKTFVEEMPTDEVEGDTPASCVGKGRGGRYSNGDAVVVSRIGATIGEEVVDFTSSVSLYMSLFDAGPSELKVVGAAENERCGGVTVTSGRK